MLDILSLESSNHPSILETQIPGNLKNALSELSDSQKNGNSQNNLN